MEFVCPDPKAEVRAANVRATIDAFGAMPSLAKLFISEQKLDPERLTPDRYIPVQAWLDAMKRIQQEVGELALRDVGAKIIENADVPPVFTSVDQLLEQLDTVYYLNHRGDVGHYRVARQADGSIVVRCETPYPRAFERGLIEGVCRHPRLTANGRWRAAFEDGAPGTDTTIVARVSKA